MDGPQHYREAESVNALALAAGHSGHHDQATALALRAQVHATLALVAATVEAEALRGWEVAR